ncbi:23S rRNA (uridine2552-2'-O)-methyltransferase [Caulobacter ginsengisoli]|uniref:Ribosomal RNA large subunit methyltransferase E n=1 Tax=Caulobacter ginsengisoli TaxID=400775 RepID=A0ABU0IPR0_9CAUL|nr:RlmE family RNA methyltransferase [Caulobacter ginsengisoli]MDQ0463985.1 23S rRNA (uridine2552-2'-O)-methyltransferase [Caulobacter ginsengisoli]
MTDDEIPKRRLVKKPTGGNEGGRGKPARLKTAKGRTPSSQAWLERQINDPYAAEARALGYRSRAAFKLTEIDDRLHLIKKGSKIIDLGCAPGGWVQIALQREAGKVVGVDLLEVDPLPPAELIQMDFTDPACGPRLIEMLGGAPDVVLSDMAPNTVGHRKTDHLRIMGLIEVAAEFAISVLKPGGSFVAKAFQGGETAPTMKILKQNFTDVKNIKPKASRTDSAEVYLVATGFKG